MKKMEKFALTGAVVALAVGLVTFKYLDYVRNPWTRDGQVRANVIAVAPRVTGPIVELPISDNQRVKAGDLLFRIDKRMFQAQFDQAKANLDNVLDQLSGLQQQVNAAHASVEQSNAQVSQAEAQLQAANASAVQTESEYRRYEKLVQDGYTSRSNYDTALKNYQVANATRDQTAAALMQARASQAGAQAQLATAIARRGAEGDANAQLRSAKATLETARLNLEFTEQRASVDGFVTNLNLRLGSQANANQPAMALVDERSFWVDAYFRETQIENVRAGDNAYITLMAFPKVVVPGRVDSLAWGISQQDGSTASNLLPVVQPSFEWIRLAQRIPVRIAIGDLPKGVTLRVGTTASVLIRGGSGERMPHPLPRPLQ